MRPAEPSTLTIADPPAARILANVRQRHLLLGLINRDRSLSELAAESGMALNLLHRHVTGMLRLGLVTVSRIEKRAGRPVRYYRASAQAFFVPAELASGAPDPALARRMTEALEAALQRDFEGILYSSTAAGPQMRIVRASGAARSASDLWQELHLSAADADALAASLRQLCEDYRSRQDRTGARYLLHLAMART